MIQPEGTLGFKGTSVQGKLRKSYSMWIYVTDRAFVGSGEIKEKLQPREIVSVGKGL